MTGAELQAIRKSLGLSATRFGRALGFAGTPNTINVQIRRYENGTRAIPAWIARLAYLYGKHGIPKQFVDR